jgi:hypothetical protein
MRNGTHNDLFPHRDRKLFHIKTRKIIALMTPRVSFAPRALSDGARFAVEKTLFRKATFAADVFRSKALTIGQFALINAKKPFLESLIIIFCGVKNSAHATIQTARRQEFGIDLHITPP